MALIFPEGLEQVLMAPHDYALRPLVSHGQPGPDTLVQS